MPEGVTIYRNRHEAVWAGEVEECIKAEIRWYSNSARGNTSPKLTQRIIMKPSENR